MFVYNIATKVDHGILEEWLKWQKEIYIIEIMETKCFYEHRFYRLLEHEDEMGKTFIIQFLANSTMDYEKFIEQFALTLQKKSFDKWSDRIICFTTVLEEVQ